MRAVGICRCSSFVLTLNISRNLDVTDVAWSPGDRYLASVGLDSAVIVWCGFTLGIAMLHSSFSIDDWFKAKNDFGNSINIKDSSRVSAGTLSASFLRLSQTTELWRYGKLQTGHSKLKWQSLSRIHLEAPSLEGWGVCWALPFFLIYWRNPSEVGLLMAHTLRPPMLPTTKATYLLRLSSLVIRGHQTLVL
jgi:WD40 repeat protein